MSSKRRRSSAAAASRANGKKSHGPVTPEGKARSAANAPAARHGLSAPYKPPVAPGRLAHSICLTNEDPLEFSLLHDALATQFAPGTTAEHLIIEEMAVARWCLQRAWVMQSALLDNQMDHMTQELSQTYASIDEPTRATLAFRSLTENSPSLATLLRYETRLSRQFERCLRNLATLRKESQQQNLPVFPAEPNGAEAAPPQHDLKETDLAPQFRQQPERPAEAPPQPVTNSEPVPGGLTVAQPAPEVAPVCPSDAQPDPERGPGAAPPVPRAA